MMKKKSFFITLIIFLAVVLDTKGGAWFVPQSFLGLEQTSADEPISELKNEIAVTVTAYSPAEEECDSDPYITAYQKPVREGTIAISRDLEREFGWRLGDKVHLKGIGVFEVWDRMHPKWKKKVDIFFHDSGKAVSFGIRQARVMKVERKDNKGA